ncbi:hypothetical protein MKZ38_001240 [Zalerion maritima]|uniref:Uncharacterized protein n=1 Tax=Zalerion maritima TaxID=339359 RepID=A0AAD5WTE1_9PEZI|nr:hypothetical protein MKZ38_001240 [Zalerion maritima]
MRTADKAYANRGRPGWQQLRYDISIGWPSEPWNQNLSSPRGKCCPHLRLSKKIDDLHSNTTPYPILTYFVYAFVILPTLLSKMQGRMILVLLSLLSFSLAGVIQARSNDIMTPLKDLSLRGFDLAPDGSNSLLASNNVVRCDTRVPLKNAPKPEGLAFNETSAIASKNSLVGMLNDMSNDNASLAADSQFSQACRGAGAWVSNFGARCVEIHVPVHVIDQALWVVIDHCVKKHNMTGKMSSPDGVQVGISEWGSEERCGSRYSPTGGLKTKTPQKGGPAATVLGLIGLLYML